jgi:hypothetical protein
MYRNILRIFYSCLVTLILAVSFARVQAAPDRQATPFPTPTPGPDGRIFYIVQPDDTLWRIAAVSGVPLDELRALNNLGPDEVIRPGQQLLLGLGGPSVYTPTPGPTSTTAPVVPTPTAGPGTATLCILLFNDRNGDSLRQEDEPSIPGGAISVASRDGSISQSADTEQGTDPHCFENLPEGDYNISVAIPDNYNPTTVTNYPTTLNAGAAVYLDFGAQSKSDVVLPTSAPEATTTPKRTPLLGIAGALLLLVGIGLGIYASRLRKL